MILGGFGCSEVLFVKCIIGKSFEDFIEQYAGYSRKDNAKFGYFSNPNAKWDWWVVGGRWDNRFLIKPEYKELHGDKSNVALKKHIDWEYMMQSAAIKAEGGIPFLS